MSRINLAARTVAACVRVFLDYFSQSSKSESLRI